MSQHSFTFNDLYDYIQVNHGFVTINSNWKLQIYDTHRQVNVIHNGMPVMNFMFYHEDEVGIVRVTSSGVALYENTYYTDRNSGIENYMVPRMISSVLNDLLEKEMSMAY